MAALATIGLLIVGWRQITAARNEARGWQTLAACERYESDIVLDRCLRRLLQGNESGKLKTEPATYRIDVTTILNYLDGIAIGIEQYLYDESIVRDHLEPIVRWYVSNYLEAKFAESMDINPKEDYQRLMDLCERWSKDRLPTRFRAGTGFLRRRTR